MKRLFALLTVALMVVVMSLSASAAEVTYMADQEIPYATTAPTLDGVLSEGEWTALFPMNPSNLKIVGGTPDATFKVDTYLAWDETYLYVAHEVVNPTKGTLYFGQGGDDLRLYMDFNGIAAANPSLAPDNGNMHALSTKVIAVIKNGGNAITGYGIQYNSQLNNVWNDGDISDSANVGANGGATGVDEHWYMEYRLEWTKLGDLLSATYAGQTMPTIEPGMVFTFMPSWHDWNTNYNGQANWFIGQNVGVTENAAAVPSCFGFRGTLAAAPAPETPDAPATADALSIGILAGATALAFAALVIGKKK